MKKGKKLFSLLLAAALVLGLSVTAFAEDTATDSKGSITIDNATEGQTYTIYKVFDLTYGGNGEAEGNGSETEGGSRYSPVSYTITATDDNTDLISALKSDDSVFTLTASATNSSIYVVTLKENTDDDAVIAYVKSIADKLTAGENKVATSSGTVEFTGLDYGYYYITSTLGTLVTIDSTLPDVIVKDKNAAPTVEKKVQEDSKESDDDSWGESNTADIGDTVNFKTTIKAYAGAEGYVLHDTMGDGFTFGDTTSVSVTETVGETTKTLTAYTDGATSWDYKFVTPDEDDGDGCTFEIEFNQTYLDTITGTADNPTTIVVSYSADVNENATIGGNGNENTSFLRYSGTEDATKTADSTTTTYVYGVDILKYTAGEDDAEKTPLSGAEFVLYKTVTEDEEEVTYYAKVTDGKLTGWTKNSTSDCTEDTTDETYATTLTSDTDGKIGVDGLDADTYYLEETKAPNGYNLLDDAVKIVIDEDGKVYVNDSKEAATDGLVEVENNTGAELPSTGGVGTTIFYVVGSILVVGAVVLLITKRRMNGGQD